MSEKILVLGLSKSGIAAAKLGIKLGYEVYLTEGKKEVNDIASNIINAFTLLKEKQVNNQSLYNFSLGNSSIKRLDGGIYNGSLALNFTVKQL